jgi:hypothetical protein
VAAGPLLHGGGGRGGKGGQGGGRRRSGGEGQMERVGQRWSRMGGEAAAPALALAGGAAAGLRSE